VFLPAAIEPAQGEVTALLEQWRQGRGEALDELVPYIYAELHRLATHELHQERAGHTLQPTALVNEVYLRLAGGAAPALENRRHFYAIAARLMRQILVDHARRHLSGKRGEGAPLLSLDDALGGPATSALEFTALDEALERLAQIEERKARLIELRYFTGLSIEECAGVIGVSVASVYRDLAFATAFLGRQLKL